MVNAAPCLVEVAAGSTADPRPMPKACSKLPYHVMDGMVVKNITSPEGDGCEKWCG